MDEHEDDLPPHVEEEAAQETEAYPNTADEDEDDPAGDDPLNVDEDESEL
jgi:hypothetical protein